MSATTPEPLKRGWYARLINNTVFANVVLLAIVLLAVFAGGSMTRESSPELIIPAIGIETPYPGADPEEVEEGVTQKIEAAVDGLQGIRQYMSSSREGYSEVAVEVADGWDIAEVKDRIRNAVDSIDTFPVDAEQPRISQAVEMEEVAIVAIWGDAGERQLKELAEVVRSELQDLPELSQADIFSTRPYEVSIEVSEDRLQQHGLSLADINRAVRESSLNLSAGSLRLKGEEIRIRTLGKRYLGPEFADIVVSADVHGNIVTLGDVATIRDAFSEEDNYGSFNGKPCAMVEVMQVQGEDSIAISKAVEEYIAEKQATLPPGIQLTKTFDNTEFIKSQINVITKNGALGLAFILLILWLFLEARLAFWVAMGIPISLGGAVIILWLMGASLNQISLIGMIVVMGIIVDDAIVVGEAVFVHRRLGKDPLQAAIDGVREVGLPVVASVTTTILAFAPMAFVGGVFGQFARQMPLVATAALTVSLLECLFLLPAHLKHSAERPDRPRKSFWQVFELNRYVGRGLERFVDGIYAPFVLLAVRYRYVTFSAAVGLVLVTVGLIGGGVIKVVMWPAAEADIVESEIEFPPGTPLEVVRDAVERTSAALERVAERTDTKNGDPLLRNVATFVPYRLDTGGRIIAEIAEARNRDVSTREIMMAWREELGTIPGALSQEFSGAEIGSGGEWDIEFWLTGNDFDTLRAAAEELKEKYRSYEGVYDIGDNVRTGKTELQVALKPSAHTLGLTLQDVSRQLYAAYFGEEALRLQRGREDVRVRVRYPRDERETLSAFDRMRVQTPDGHYVPLRAVADISFAEGVSSITGVNGKRGVRVSANVDRNRANSVEINNDLMYNYLDAFVAQYPGVSWAQFGGAQEDQRSMADLRRNSLIAIVGIFMLLATVFRSYIQPVIIMVVIPYGLVGAVLGHIVIGIPLSFLSIGGITALAGVLVNDSIVFIERVNANLALGMSLTDAVCQAGTRRFRAIFLTSISTCAGLAPLIAETDLQAQIVKPMAVSLAGGVLCGTVLTLILVPAFLVIMNDFRRLVRRFSTGAWPTPEDVEPATLRDSATETTVPRPSTA